MCKNNQGYESYQVNVRKHTDLTGGLITSTAQAEADGKNSFSTGTLGYSDIENHANYSGSAFGASVQADINGGWDGRQVRDKVTAMAMKPRGVPAILVIKPVKLVSLIRDQENTGQPHTLPCSHCRASAYAA